MTQRRAVVPSVVVKKYQKDDCGIQQALHVIKQQKLDGDKPLERKQIASQRVSEATVSEKNCSNHLIKGHSGAPNGRRFFFCSQAATDL